MASTRRRLPSGGGATALRIAGLAQPLIFRPSLSCLGLLTDEKVQLPQAPHVGSAFIRELANRVVKEMRNGDSFSPMVIEGSVLELIATFGRMYEARKWRNAIPNWLKQCREMLESRPGVGATH
jgi:hypothetical protein